MIGSLAIPHREMSPPSQLWKASCCARQIKAQQNNVEITATVHSRERLPKSEYVVVFPSRAVAIENALRLFSPRLAVVDEHLTRHLPKEWLTSLAIEDDKTTDDVLIVIEAPRQSDLMIELIEKMKPQVVITGMEHFEAITSYCLCAPCKHY